MAFRARCSALLTRRRRVKDRGGLGSGELEHLAEEQHGPLGPGEVLQRGDERELDASRAAGIARPGRRRCSCRRNCRGNQSSGHGSSQTARHRLAKVAGLAQRWTVVRRKDSARSAGDQSEAGVRGDPVEPGPQRAAALEASQPAPRAEQCLLNGILGVLNRAEHAVAVARRAPRRCETTAARKRPRRPTGQPRAAQARAMSPLAPSSPSRSARRRMIVSQPMSGVTTGTRRGCERRAAAEPAPLVEVRAPRSGRASKHQGPRSGCRRSAVGWQVAGGEEQERRRRGRGAGLGSAVG